MLNPKMILLLFSAAVVISAKLNAAGLTIIMDDTMEDSIFGGNYQTNYVGSSVIIDGEVFFSYKGTGLWWWTGRELKFHDLGGSFYYVSEDNDSIYARVRSDSNRIIRWNKSGMETIRDLGGSIGGTVLAAPQVSGGKMAFTISEGDYNAVVYYDGSEYTYIARNGEDIFEDSNSIGSFYDLIISDDGSRVSFRHSSDRNAIYEWDGGSIRILNDDFDSDNVIFYIGNSLYFSGRYNSVRLPIVGLFRMESNGLITQVVDGSTPLPLPDHYEGDPNVEYYFDGRFSSGTSLVLWGKTVAAANGKVALIAHVDRQNHSKNYYAGYILEPVNGVPVLQWESEDITSEPLEWMNLVGFDGKDMNVVGYDSTNSIAFFATTIEPRDEWGGFSLSAEGYVDTGDWLGWLHVSDNSNWVYVYFFQNFAYLPEERAINLNGAWTYLRK